MTTRRTPIQIRWRSPNTVGEDRLLPFARWAQAKDCWYAENWPPIRGYRIGVERGGNELEIHERGETLMRAIAVGPEGIVAVRDEDPDEQSSQSDWHVETCLENILTDVRNAWKRRECIIPIRVATLTRRDTKELTDLSARMRAIDIEEWRAHWSRETISPALAQEAWEALLPHTTGKRGQPRESAEHREAILRQALSPSRNHGLDTVARARATGLRSVLRAMETDRALHGDFLLPELGERDRAIAKETISFVCLDHFNVALDHWCIESART